MAADIRQLVQRRLSAREKERKENAQTRSKLLTKIAQQEAKATANTQAAESLESFLLSYIDHKIQPGDLDRAREWAREHFPGGDNDGLFDSPKFRCEFFGTRMAVQPKVYGIVSPLTFRYQLLQTKEGLLWVGQNHITGQLIKLEIQ